MTKHRKRRSNRHLFAPFLSILIVILGFAYVVTVDLMAKSELKKAVRNNPDALAPISFERGGTKISVYLDYQYPKYRRISPTRFLLSDRPGGQDFLDFFPSESAFLKANPDVVRKGTAQNGWVSTGWKTADDKELISGYSFSKRYHYYNVNAEGVKNNLRTNCVLYLPGLSAANFPILYFNADPGEDGADTCTRIRNIKLRFTENGKEIVLSKNAAANMAVRLPPTLLHLPEQYGILVDMDKPDGNMTWEMGIYEPGKNKNTTINRLKMDARTGKFICAWWEYGRENSSCQNDTGK